MSKKIKETIGNGDILLYAKKKRTLYNCHLIGLRKQNELIVNVI